MKRAKPKRTQAQLALAKGIAFAECATGYIKAHQVGWRNAKHAEQWRNTLATYAFPIFGALPVQAVDTDLVMKVLDPIWTTKPETASRLRGRIEAVFDYATVRRYREGENPARWRGHLDQLLPKRGKVRAVKHHPALPYTEIGAFFIALREQEGVAALALEFCILTPTRTGEVVGAQWEEIDMAGALWTIPASRIKAGKEHRVPLSPPALAILRKLAEARDGAFVFPGGRVGKPLSNIAMAALLERIGRSEITVHGFRSSFRDWAAERTNFPREVVERALAHAIGDKVEAAYRRGDLFEKRRELMVAWARHCTGDSKPTIVPLATAGE